MLAKPREAGDLLVPLGVVLHGAAAEGIEAGIYAEVQLAQARKVADKAQFPYLRNVQFAAEEVIVRQV